MVSKGFLNYGQRTIKVNLLLINIQKKNIKNIYTSNTPIDKYVDKIKLKFIPKNERYGFYNYMNIPIFKSNYDDMIVRIIPL